MNDLKEELYKLINKDKTIFDYIQESALDGMWYLDMENPGHNWFSPKFWITFGYDPDEMAGDKATWQDLIFREDIKLIDENMEKHVANPDYPFDQLLRYKHKNGSTVWIRCRGMAIRDDHGKAIRMIGVHTDITKSKKREELLERCNSEAKIGYWELDMAENSLYWSTETRKIHDVDDPNFTPDVESGINFYEEGYSRNRIRELFEKAVNEGIPYEQELKIITARGITKWVKAIGIPEISGGKCIRIYGTFQDIDERKLFEENLAKEKQKFENVISGTKLATWEWNVQTGEMVFNDRWAEIIGYTLEELEPVSIETWTRFVHQDDNKISEKKLNDCFEKKTEFYECECRMKHKDGHWVWVYDRGKVFTWTTDGKPLMMVGTHQDISENKKTTEKLGIFIQEAPTAIAMFGNDMRYIAASQKWVEDYKLHGVELIGRSHYDIFPEIGEDWKRIHRECLDGTVHSRDEDKFVRSDGSVQWLKWEDKPWYTDSATKKIGGIIMYTEDITAKKEIEEQLSIRNQAFKGNFDNAAIGMTIQDKNGRWLQVNRKISELLGYSREELMKLSFRDVTHPDDLPHDLILLNELQTGKKSHYQIEKRYINKQGETVNTILATSVVRDLNNEILYLVTQIIDITELKLAENQLAEALGKIQGILDASTQVSIISTNINGIITIFNKGAENLLGYSAAEVINRKTPEFIHLKEEIEARRKEMSEELGKEIEGFAVYTEYAKTGRSDTRECTYVRKDGTTFPVQVTVSAMRVANKITGYLGIAADLTKIKAAEKEIQSLLDVTRDQNNRLKNFAHIVSHNLRSHSGNIDFLIDLLVTEKPEFADLEILQLTKAASVNLKETIANLNEVALINTSAKESLSSIPLYEYVEKALSSVAALALNNKVQIINEVEKGINILGIPAYIDSILINFLTNGIKYRAETRAPFIRLNTQLHEPYVVLCIEDNGLGIDLKKHGDKLFGMYKTFHNKPDSRGIGLFISKSQIEAMEGKVEVESTVDVETKFKIYLKHEKG